MSAKGRPNLRDLEITAYSQHGYFTVAQARQGGVSAQLLNYHCVTGRFEKLGRGVYRLRGFPAGPNDEVRSAWMAAGPEAIVCGESALAIFDLADTVPNATHLLIPRRSRGRRPAQGVLLHVRPDEEKVAIVRRDGLPLTTPARSIVDALGRLQPEQAEMAIKQALRLGLTTVAGLRDEADRRRRSRMVENVVARLGV